jgi:MFS family permease
MSAANSLTRAACILISTRISATKMLFTNMSLLFAGNIMLLLFSSSNAHMVWVSIIVIGIGNGSTMPALFSFLSDKMETSNSIIGIFTFARSCAQSVFALIVGYFIETNSLVFVVVNIASLIVSTVILIVFQFKKKDSFDVK